MSSNVKLSLGSKVRIKDKKWYDELRGDFGIDSAKISYGFTEEMAEYCGKIATITDVINNRTGLRENKYIYRIDIDKYGWSWGSDMFDIIKKGIEIE